MECESASCRFSPTATTAYRKRFPSLTILGRVGSRAAFQAAFGCYRSDTGLKPWALPDWAFSPKTGTTASSLPNAPKEHSSGFQDGSRPIWSAMHSAVRILTLLPTNPWRGALARLHEGSRPLVYLGSSFHYVEPSTPMRPQKRLLQRQRFPDEREPRL